MNHRARAPGGRYFMQVEIFSDVVCPWCYIGKRRFEQALADFPHRDEVEVTWRAFELDPTAPVGGGSPVIDSLAEKYGVSVEQIRASQANITEIAASVGLEYHLEDFGPRQHVAGPRAAAPRARPRCPGRPQGATAPCLLHRGRGAVRRRDAGTSCSRRRPRSRRGGNGSCRPDVRPGSRRRPRARPIVRHSRRAVLRDRPRIRSRGRAAGGPHPRGSRPGLDGVPPPDHGHEPRRQQTTPSASTTPVPSDAGRLSR